MKHEQKYCPRCQLAFECKVGSIMLCQCSGIKLNGEEREYMNAKFCDCLCAYCMKEIKTEYHALQFEKKLRLLSGMFNSNA